MPDTATKRILIVDDNEDHLYLTKARLEMVNSNLTCTAVHSGEECLAALRQSEYDLIISDYDMRPGMSGLDLLGYIKQNSIEIPVIVISEIGDEVIEQRARSGGAADFIDKSVGYDDFPSIVDSIHKAISETECKPIDRMRRSEQAKAQIFADDGEIGVLLDAEGQKIEDASAEAVRLLTGGGNLGGAVLAGFVKPKDRTELRRVILGALRGERSAGTISFVGHGGSAADYRVECVARRNRGKVTGVRISARIVI